MACHKRGALPCTLAAAALTCASTSARAGSPFDQGSLTLSLAAGSGAFGTERYIIAGGGVGIFGADGIELGADIEAWFAASPSIVKVSPEVRYVKPTSETVALYVGAFASRWLIGEPYEDWNTAGGRGGAYFLFEGGAFLSVGAVYERVLSGCSVDCVYVYPELALSIAL